MAILCASCKGVKDNTIQDRDTGHHYCTDCARSYPVPSHVLGMLFLLNTIPFRVGDVVECRTAGVLFDGIGVVESISMDPKDYGSPIYPSFQVRLTDKRLEDVPDVVNYTEVCLRKVES